MLWDSKHSDTTRWYKLLYFHRISLFYCLLVVENQKLAIVYKLEFLCVCYSCSLVVYFIFNPSGSWVVR